MLRTLLVTAGLSIASFGAWAQPYSAQPDGPVFSPDQIAKGITMSAAECAVYRSTVYVTAEGTGVCFRYYLSTAGGASNQVVYFLSGDKNRKTFAFDPAKLDSKAASMSTEYHIPAIYLARMGLDGSSGLHRRYRRTWFEVEATHLAIDAINARYGFRMIHVMGQSGGGHLTGSLVGTRADIGCAVPGSGRLAFDSQYVSRQARRAPELRHYNPHDNLAQVVRHSMTERILVVTDPNDNRVPAHMQTPFVRDVQMAGGRIAQIFVTATDPLSHGATPYTREVMAACLSGRSDTEITATVIRLSEKRWTAYIAKHRQQIGGAGMPASLAFNASASPAVAPVYSPPRAYPAPQAHEAGAVHSQPGGSPDETPDN